MFNLVVVNGVRFGVVKHTFSLAVGFHGLNLITAIFQVAEFKDDFFKQGCPRPPFETSYYLNRQH